MNDPADPSASGRGTGGTAGHVATTDAPRARPSRTSRAPAPTPPNDTSSRRLISLDAFRGLTIAAMLLVNNPGSWAHIYPPLQHAEWHGWTPTDLIFPYFLFIVGVAMTFSLGKRLDRGATRGDLLVKAAKRSLVLFGLGLLLHGFPSYDLATIRIPGVLQRIALAYFAATLVVVYTAVRGQGLTAAALLLGYWALMTLVPVPDGGAGVLEPGRDLGAYIDRMVFGTQHLWAQSETWDPEGLLSTLPAVATVLFGVLAGHWIRSERTLRTRAAGLAAASVAAIGVGLTWGTVFPINKNLWTSSYTVFTAGMAGLTLAACFALIEVRGRRRWATPFVAFGMNAIAAFVLSGLGARVMGLINVTAGGTSIPLKAWLYETLFTGWLTPVNASLAFALSYVAFWLGVVAFLHRRRIFIKV